MTEGFPQFFEMSCPLSICCYIIDFFVRHCRVKLPYSEKWGISLSLGISILPKSFYLPISMKMPFIINFVIQIPLVSLNEPVYKDSGRRWNMCRRKTEIAKFIKTSVIVHLNEVCLAMRRLLCELRKLPVW